MQQDTTGVAKEKLLKKKKGRTWAEVAKIVRIRVTYFCPIHYLYFILKVQYSIALNCLRHRYLLCRLSPVCN